ncbi:hypothetical protein E2C01_000133 [Portunus trituberculatus]|uniref:Uncharacterized protein n=1 Tax=Portunus trituberculatus TaxID=210409 RepID=A0A5B7CDH4_PORTR|nr:hypothetical protein [Portunus trituberculatus]
MSQEYNYSPLPSTLSRALLPFHSVLALVQNELRTLSANLSRQHCDFMVLLRGKCDTKTPKAASTLYP